MQVSVETLKGLERKLSIEVPEEQVTSQYQTRVSKMAREAKIKGFRPGKVPTREIERLYGEGLRQEIIGQLMQQSLYQAISDEGLRIAGSPSISEVKADKGEPLKFVAEFEILPELKLKDLDGVKVEKITSEINDKVIDKTIDNLRKQQVEWTDVARAAKDEDQITLSFDGTLKGEAINNGTAKELPLVLGSGMMPAEFDKKVIGMKADDELEFDITYPKDHPNKDVAGEKIHFKVKAHKVCEPTLPELNEEFIGKLGITGGEDALRKEIVEALGKELKRALKNINKQKVVDKLLEINKKIELPNALVKSEIDMMHKQAGHNHGPGEQCEQTKEFDGEARKRVALGLIIGEFANQYQIKSDPQIVREMVESMAMGYGKPEEVLEWYYADPKRLAPIEWLVLEDQVAEKLLESATIKEKAVVYDDVMKELQQ